MNAGHTKRGQQVLCHGARVSGPSLSSPNCDSRDPLHACFCTKMTSLKYGCPFLSSCWPGQARPGRAGPQGKKNGPPFEEGSCVESWSSAGCGARACGKAGEGGERDVFVSPVTFIWVQGDVGFSFCISQVCARA